MTDEEFRDAAAVAAIGFAMQATLQQIPALVPGIPQRTELNPSAAWNLAYAIADTGLGRRRHERGSREAERAKLAMKYPAEQVFDQPGDGNGKFAGDGPKILVES